MKNTSLRAHWKHLLVGILTLLALPAVSAAALETFESNAELVHVRWSMEIDASALKPDAQMESFFPSAEWVPELGRLVPVQTLLVACPVGTTPVVVNRGASYLTSEILFPDADINATSRDISRETISLRAVESWRGFRIAHIAVRLAEPDRSGSRLLSSIEFEVRFTGASAPQAASEREQNLLPTFALNGSMATRWWALPKHRKTRLDESTDSWPNLQLYKLGVTEAGVYAMTVEWLQSQGVPALGAASQQLKVFGNGGKMLPAGLISVPDSVLRENAVLVEDGGDGRLDQGDRILFYAEGLKGLDYTDGSLLGDNGHASPYATENAYWVGIDPAGEPGKRMNPLPEYSATSTLVQTYTGRNYVEQEQFIYAANADQSNSGIVWYMATLDAQTERSFSITLESANTGRGTLRLRMRGSGIGSGFDVRVNDQYVSQGTFSDPMTITIPTGVFAAGNNIVRLTNRSSSGVIQLNYIEAEYERSTTTTSGTIEILAPTETAWFGYQVSGLESSAYLLDISNPLEPRVRQGQSFSDSSYSDSPKRYFASAQNKIRTPLFRGRKDFDAADYSRLRDPQNEAGIIILTYDGWYDDLAPLIEMHRDYQEEPLHAVRVKLGDVFDEFSWGVYDPVAIRNFLRYAYENWRGPAGTSEPPRYVLLVGDGDYDYRNLLSNTDDNWMPPWENSGTCTDDFYVDFDDTATMLDMISGRWPVQSAQEVRNIVEKTVEYAVRPLYGSWKNTATFVADDEWKDGRCGERFHTSDSENLINNVLPGYFTFRKLYEILYPFRQSNSTSQKPDATRDLIETVNNGTLLINYVGHGNERVWTDEQMFVMDRDNPLIENDRVWPVIVAGTCTWGGFDRPNERCFPEHLLSGEYVGSVACIAATRFTYVNQNQILTEEFYTEIFRQGIERRRSLGEALLIVKPLRSNNSLYHCLGNPVLRLATPEYFAFVDARDDSLQAGALFNLSGYVSRTDNSAETEVRFGPRGSSITDEEWADFQGIVEARVFDSEDSAAYFFPQTTDCSVPSQVPYYYGLPGNAIFRGRSSVVNGRFDITFRVPRDIQYGGTNAKVSLYFYGKSDSEPDSADGIGIEQPLRIASEAATVSDSIPPQIETWLENTSFRSGDQVSRTPRLIVRLGDDSGINLSGEVGHRITVRIDEAQAEDITQFFNYDVDSYTNGELSRTIGPFSEGPHRLTVEAWDSFNNLNVETLDFVVSQSSEAGFAIRDVLNWPNPMSSETFFTYSLTQDGATDVKVRIFTMTGKLVDEMDGLGTRQLYNSNSAFPWHGKDRNGRDLANGVYFYKVIAQHEQGYSAEATGKLIILR
ncbi:MAG: type IX secretion system sortase PorU [Calditrichaeota bacterium]|nr:type IX secretion system sortase PorU [Calditrichota bacterium]MCB9366444.1 type IX secretion system sortase PorU [Calditrichota bacterium]